MFFVFFFVVFFVNIVIFGFMFLFWNFSVLDIKFKNSCFNCDLLLWIVGILLIFICVDFLLIVIFKLFMMLFIMVFRLMLLNFLFCVEMWEKVRRFEISMDICFVVVSMCVR